MNLIIPNNIETHVQRRDITRVRFQTFVEDNTGVNEERVNEGREGVIAISGERGSHRCVE